MNIKRKNNFLYKYENNYPAIMKLSFLFFSDKPDEKWALARQTGIKYAIAKFGRQKKILFVHIRDVSGTAEDFRETFHDNGPTDMPDLLELYNKIGFNGPLRSDHVPTMAGEENDHAGYAMKGNLFGIGYIKGMLDALKIEYS